MGQSTFLTKTKRSFNGYFQHKPKGSFYSRWIFPVYTDSSRRMCSSSNDHSLFNIFSITINIYTFLSLYIPIFEFLSFNHHPHPHPHSHPQPRHNPNLTQDMMKDQPKDKLSAKHETPKTTTDPIEIEVHGLKAKFFLNRPLQDIIPQKYLAEAEQTRTFITTTLILSFSSLTRK